MNVKINSRGLRGSICAPSSPSYAIKAITAAALAKTATHLAVNNITPEVKSALNSVRSLGAMAWEEKDEIEIHPTRRGLRGSFIDAGESRELIDIMLPVVSALYGYGEFTGEVTSPLIPLLNSHGLRASSDKPPFIIRDRINAGRYVIPKDISAYSVSGLLLALPLTGQESEIILCDRLENREYVSETVEILSKFGIEVSEYENRFVIPAKSKFISPSKMQIEGNFESCACWLAAKSMGCKLEISGLRQDAKKEIWHIFEDLARADTVNAMRFPYLAPIFAACAATGENKCRIVTGRRDDTAAALSSLGAKIIPAQDGFTVIGTERLCGGVCSSYENPYIAVAAAICSVGCSDDVEIYGIDSVSKVYPRFFDDFKSLGGNVRFFE